MVPCWHSWGLGAWDSILNTWDADIPLVKGGKGTAYRV